RRHRYLLSFPTRRSSDLRDFRFWTTVGACLRIAAAVFEVGRLLLSPSAKTFGNRTCCNVFLSTSTHPFSSARELSAINAGGPIRSEEHTSELQSRENLVC